MLRTAKLFSILALVAFLAGCEEKKKDVATEPTQEASAGYDYSTGATGTYGPETTTGGSDATASYGTGTTASYTTTPNTTYEAASESISASPPPAGGRHVVGKGETLYSLARLYYNDQARWRDIYEANRGSIPDPNRVRVGQELLIP